MAPATGRMVATGALSLLFLLLPLHLPFAATDYVVGRLSAFPGGALAGDALPPPRPMVLPLLLSFANSSRRHAAARSSNLRRQLEREDPSVATAQMRLQDDLLANGYYTTRLLIGTPPQEFALIVDSGSTLTYVPCASCEKCGNHQDPRFQPDLSSTFESVKCNIDCTCDKDQVHCIYERQYAEMSSTSGFLGVDLVSYGDESILKPQRIVFGCETSETGDLFSQHADGIMGLGRGPLSIVDQLVEKGVISDSFSLCYGGMGIGGGAMVLGGIPPPANMIFASSNPARSPYYNIDLKEIQVDDKPLHLDPRVFDDRHGTVLDSGTTYAYLPEEAFIAFKDAILSKLQALKQIPGPDPNFHDICFSGAGSNVSKLSKTFPKVDLVFASGEKLLLSPENYLFRHSKIKGAYCLGVFQNGKDPSTLLGGIIVRNTLVTYDRANERIGFWRTNCSVLWERLHMEEAPSPAPSTHNSSSLYHPPAPSPGGLYDLKDHFQVGLITFDMSLNMTYYNVVSHIKELASLIAEELELNPDQVRLTNISSNGNKTLIRWSIFPEDYSSYFSSTTAMGIISTLTEHHVHLPEKYGSYQLVEWNVQPLSRRSWWKQHLLGLAAGVSAMIILSLSALWYFWGYRNRGLGSYRPVDSAVAEQELQPMNVHCLT